MGHRSSAAQRWQRGDVGRHPVAVTVPRIPVLAQALQEREEAVSNGKLATIIFIRDRNARRQEVSWLAVTR